MRVKGVAPLFALALLGAAPAPERLTLAGLGLLRIGTPVAQLRTRFRAVADQPGTLPLRACFIGRLVPLKGVAMAIEAAAPLLADGRMRFDIIGDGSERAALEAQGAVAE